MVIIPAASFSTKLVLIWATEKINLTAYRSKTTTIFVRNLSFLYLPKYNVFLVEISTLHSKCVQVCAHFFAEFSES